ncbi:methyltransferase, TIGR04325 family [Chitinibacter sp. SCUT-21]|uniref:methyltransferase, TIGR04325 family n=1 Tax=Chitinibacter sp. SCUT-21 TaxID=2970891 RepID=UPI0035A57E40
MHVAPVILFIYNRPAHLSAVINSLKKNKLAIETDLIVFSDGPKSDQDIKNVEACRSIINDQDFFFKSLTRHYSQSNQGLSTSIINSLNKIFETHEQAIILEDDLICSEYFLEFMNKYLNYYKDAHDVLSIHAYSYPIHNELPDVFFLKGADCWGWGTWKRGWQLFNPNAKALYEELVKTDQLNYFDYNGKAPFSRLLKKVVKNQSQSWAIRWHASAVLQNKLTLYSKLSFIKNIGNDASGTHSKKSDIYCTEIADFVPHETPLPEHSAAAYNQFSSFFKKNSSKFDHCYLFLFHNYNSIWMKIRKWTYNIAHARKISFNGPYESWSKALDNSTGYDSDNIINKTLESTKQVIDGIAVYERDSRLFHSPANEPIVANFLSDLPKNSRIIDFGGGLASLYFRHKEILHTKVNLEWHIIEQPKFIAAAKQLNFPSHIYFHRSIHDELENSTALIFSNSLQYIESPMELLDKVINHQEHQILFFRMLPTAELSIQRCFVQKVPSNIYEASYPIWVFSLSLLLSKIEKFYTVTTIEFESTSHSTYTGLEIRYVNIIAKKKNRI